MSNVSVSCAMAILLSGCFVYGEESPPGTALLEIGYADRGPTGDGPPVFVPAADGDEMSIVLAPSGLNMVTPSVRAWNVAAGETELDVAVSIDGVLIASDLDGLLEMETDTKGGSVFWDLRVAFQIELCCFVCQPAVVIGTLRDAAGTEYQGTVDLVFSRSECPAPALCCVSAEQCPEGVPANVCGS